MTVRHNWRMKFYTLLLLGLTAPAAWCDSVVIANPRVPLNHIDRDTLRAVFSMRLRTYPDDSPITVVVLPDRNPLHQAFAKRRLNLYPHQLRRTWDRLVFTGLGQAPRQVESANAMRHMVATTPGAIGYLEEDMIDDSVKRIPIE